MARILIVGNLLREIMRAKGSVFRSGESWERKRNANDPVTSGRKARVCKNRRKTVAKNRGIRNKSTRTIVDYETSFIVERKIRINGK